MTLKSPERSWRMTSSTTQVLSSKGPRSRASSGSATLWQAFPDFSVDIKLQIAEGDMVATLKTFSGTHEGEFMGIPPTGKRVAFDVFDMLRVRDGRVVRTLERPGLSPV